MKTNNENNSGFEFDETFKARALGLVDELQALQIAEGLRLESAISSVNAREYARIERKYGKDHPRTLEMAVRVAANKEVKSGLFRRYTEASTPYVDPGEGWAVDGFVRSANGAPVEGVTVAAYDQKEQWYEEFGYGCTDKTGHFSIMVDKLPEKPPSPVFMRASKDKKLLASNEVQLTPEPKSTDRVEIIIGDTAVENDCGRPVSGNEKARYLGNSGKRELHDLENTKPRCRIDKIRPDHQFYFKTEKEAQEAGYDYCAFCFGKEKSKR